MTKQRILFITTGGTIASVHTPQGLRPVLSSDELLAHLPELNDLCIPETLALCSIDSTDLGQEHWLMMARAIQENYALYDGFIICHGTDTLAYSAAALSYLIQNADKPIILTGAQQPISNEITDAKKNLRDSVICALDPGSRGVMVVFGGHVIAGTRAKKNKTISYDAFASVNFPELALVQGDRLVRYVPSPWPTGPVEFGRALDPKVFLLKLIPGMDPGMIPEIFRLYDCVIVESFGVGGIPQRLMDAFAEGLGHYEQTHKVLIQNADKPIILTGAQQPISNEITDAKKNLRDSVICALDPGSRGVMVVFGGHVIAGTRAKKNKTISYDAFASVNFPELALVQGDRLVRYVPSPWPTGPVEFGRALDPKVFLLKLIPGMDPGMIPEIFRLYDCVIVESFGVGGIPQRLMDAFAEGLGHYEQTHKVLILTTQVTYEGSDVGVYEVGKRVKNRFRFLEAHDMTIEAVVTKSMWLLAQNCDSFDQLQQRFYRQVNFDTFYH